MVSPASLVRVRIRVRVRVRVRFRVRGSAAHRCSSATDAPLTSTPTVATASSVASLRRAANSLVGLSVRVRVRVRVAVGAGAGVRVRARVRARRAANSLGGRSFWHRCTNTYIPIPWAGGPSGTDVPTPTYIYLGREVLLVHADAQRRRVELVDVNLEVPVVVVYWLKEFGV